jgi:Uma2 family endonuclease
MPREAPVSTASNFDQFLEMEIQAQERHEFVDGNLFVMPGGTGRHNRIAVNVLMRLDPAAIQARCQVFIEGVLVKTPDEIGYYPDVFVTCDSSEDTPRVKRRPSIIVEVLSESTSAIDRGEKLRNYRAIPTLELYVLLEQDEVLAEVYAKQTDGSWRHEILREDANLRFPGLNLEVPLSALYQNLPEA